MVGTSKILTVSYGTFSCTLEGFDDSFDTMKAIAEYFRDLAADDRYFGAEPPTPDAEMLTRIAEREISRRVEARTSATGIVLRAAEPVAEPVAAEPEPAPSPAAAEPEVGGAEPSPLLATSAPAAAADAAPAEPAIESVVESVAEKLQRIRAAAASKAAEPAAAAFDEAEDATEDGAEKADDLTFPSVSDALTHAVMDDEDAPDAAAADDAEEPAIEEDELAVIDTVEAPEVEPVIEDYELAESADDPDSAEAELVDEPAPTPIRARVIRMKRTEFDAQSEAEDETETGIAEAPAAEPEAVAAVEWVDEGAAEDQADTDDEYYEDESDLEHLAALDGADDLDQVDDDSPMGELDPDDEAALAAELAEVEREAEEMRAAQRTGREILEQAPVADDAMSRIMSQAEAELAEPEGNRRRAAIAQLKAAVAATEAARRLGEKARDGDTVQDAFRNDLSQVVRPRRAPVPAEARTERPRPAPLKLVASQRIDVPAPAPAAVAPVRPRRVSVADVAPEIAAPSKAVTGGFAEFAEDMGAYELADLLEAAAAYTVYVEGIEDFSRPQLMKRVREAADEDFSREDGLRVFGTLLRQGRISKVANGRFQVSEQTRFRPEPRAARG